MRNKVNMERKIGEIFEFGGEWYQCVEGETICSECDLRNIICQRDTSINNPFKECSGNYRTDNKHVIFKKLEKYGGFIKDNIRGEICQPYTIFDIDRANSRDDRVQFSENKNDFVFVVTKQNQKDMKENKLNLKPFDIQKAREGKPVCTRNGRKARIICFDTINEINYPIIALIEGFGYETLCYYNEGGKAHLGNTFDLMMLPEKKEGWININKDSGLFKSKEEAKRYCTKDYATVRVEFEI